MILINIFSNSSRGWGKVDKYLDSFSRALNALVWPVYNDGEESGEKWKTTQVAKLIGGKLRVLHSLSTQISTKKLTWNWVLSPANPPLFHRSVL